MDPYLAKIKTRNNPVGTDPNEPHFGLSPDSYWEPIRQAMGRARTYADKMNLAASTAHSDSSSTAYCLANPGVEYLVYQPSSSGSFTVQLRAGTYDYEWFNPTLGTTDDSGTFTANSGNRSFTAPFTGDAVLYIRFSVSNSHPGHLAVLIPIERGVAMPGRSHSGVSGTPMGAVRRRAGSRERKIGVTRSCRRADALPFSA